MAQKGLQQKSKSSRLARLKIFWLGLAWARKNRLDPPLPKLAYDCTICKAECKTQERLNEHVQGKKHKKMLASLGNTQTQSQFKCDICNMILNGERPYKLHLAGTNHQKKVSATTMA